MKTTSAAWVLRGLVLALLSLPLPAIAEGLQWTRGPTRFGIGAIEVGWDGWSRPDDKTWLVDPDHPVVPIPCPFPNIAGMSLTGSLYEYRVEHSLAWISLLGRLPVRFEHHRMFLAPEAPVTDRDTRLEYCAYGMPGGGHLFVSTSGEYFELDAGLRRVDAFSDVERVAMRLGERPGPFVLALLIFTAGLVLVFASPRVRWFTVAGLVVAAMWVAPLTKEFFRDL